MFRNVSMIMVQDQIRSFFVYNLNLLLLLHCFFIFSLFFWFRFVLFSFVLFFYFFFFFFFIYYFLIFFYFISILYKNTNPKFSGTLQEIQRLFATLRSSSKLCKNTQLLSLAICKFSRTPLYIREMEIWVLFFYSVCLYSVFFVCFLFTYFFNFYFFIYSSTFRKPSTISKLQETNSYFREIEIWVFIFLFSLLTFFFFVYS